MTVVIAILSGLLGIALGYAARQREQLQEIRDGEKKQAELEKAQQAVTDAVGQVATLVQENAALREANIAHENNLKMLLREMDEK